MFFEGELWGKKKKTDTRSKREGKRGEIFPLHLPRAEGGKDKIPK